MTFRSRPSPWWRRNLSSRGRFRYKLAAIEGALQAGDPRLASKFAIFTALTEGEPAASAEPLSRPGWRRPWLAKTVTLLTIAAALAGSMVLGALMPQTIRSCVAVTTAVASASGSLARGQAGGMAHGLVGSLARGPGCAAYPTRR
jgi:hypothetical protein